MSVKVLEVGACWQLDKPETESWDKIYHKRIPDFHSGLYQFGTADMHVIPSDIYDVVVFSLTAYDMERFDPKNPVHLMSNKILRFESCLSNTILCMSNICCNAKPGTRFILIGSVSADTYHPYKTRPYYAMLKAAQRSFFTNMAENNLDKQFLEIAFDTIKEDVAIKTVMNFINKNEFKEQYDLIHCDGINPEG